MQDTSRWGKALAGAYMKGYNSAPQTECPYIDHRKSDGRLTWSRSFIKAWEDGVIDSVTDGIKEENENGN